MIWSRFRHNNDSGQYFVVLTPVKINLTTSLNIFAQSVILNQVNFVIFGNENMLRTELIKQNFALRIF